MYTNEKLQKILELAECMDLDLYINFNSEQPTINGFSTYNLFIQHLHNGINYVVTNNKLRYKHTEEEKWFEYNIDNITKIEFLF